MKMKNVLLTAVSASMAFISAFSSAAPVELDEVAAVVNQDVIMQSEVDKLTENVRQQYLQAGKDAPEINALKKQVLEKLIADNLQLQAADRLGIKISDAQLEQTILSIAKEQNLSVAQLQNKLAKDGTSVAEFRHSVEEELLISDVSRVQVRRRINISEQEVEQLLTMVNQQQQEQSQYRVGHIMLKLDNDASSEELSQVTNKIKQILADVNAGSDFEALALANSQGPKALQGGDWGWMNLNDMPTLFAEAISGGKKGQVFGPIKSGAGMHILKIIDVKGKQVVTSTEVNARHILIKPSVILSDAKAKEVLDKYRRQILNGDKDFAELAKQHSEDPGSAIKGGELGWADPSLYVPAFKDEVLRLEMREISQPFRSVHGWHIVQLIGKRTADITDQANKQRAYQIIFNRRFNEEREAWVNELREEAYIQIMQAE